MSTCCVNGCEASTKSKYTGKYGYLCDAHWRKLPMRMRRRWWKDTDWSKNPPPEALVKEINDLFMDEQLKGKVDYKRLKGRKCRIVDLWTGRELNPNTLAWADDVKREVCEYVYDAKGNLQVGLDDTILTRVRRVWIRIIIGG